MKIALYQGPGIVNDISAAFAHLAQTAAQAKAGGADLLILPEMYLSGYNIGPEAARAQAQTPATLAPAQDIARGQKIALCFGYPELDGDTVYNSAVLIGPSGDILLNYRKTHLFGDLDCAMFTPGAQPWRFTELHGFKIGLLICYDIEFPEPARALSVQGAEILLIPTAQMEPYEAVARHVLPARAYENQVYTAYANHSGEEFGLGYIGISSLCGPDGTVLALAQRSEELLFAEFDAAHLARVRAADPFYRDRRPELYKNLSL